MYTVFKISVRVHRYFLSLLNWCYKVQGCSYSTAVKLEPIKMEEFRGYLTNTGCQAISMAQVVQNGESSLAEYLASVRHQTGL